MSPSSTSASTPALPLIDISPFLHPTSDASALATHPTTTALRSALLTHGFFYLTNHSIPASLTSHVLSLARTFFTTATPSQKALIRRQDPGVSLGDGARGYQVIGENVTGGRRDWHEAIDWYRPIVAGEGRVGATTGPEPAPDAEAKSGSKNRPAPYALLEGINPWPASPADFRAVYEHYVEEATRVGTAVLLAMGHALELRDPAFFVERTRESFWVMRAIGYPPLDAELAARGGVSCGEHSDYGCLTLLLADETRGALQVRGEDGGWVDADPVEGAFVVNVGDMVERWTGGWVRSTRHRVVHKAKNYRVSVPFFLEPDRECVVEPLGECLERVGSERKDGDGVRYWDHLVSKVGGNFYDGKGEKLG